MLDFGYTPEIISRNFELLDIDPAKLDGLILSHAHRDHYGGMEGFVDRFRHRMAGDMPFYIGGEGIFRERWTKGEGDEWVSWGTPNCGKGQPMQVAHTGHHASPGRFRGVRVGVRG